MRIALTSVRLFIGVVISCSVLGIAHQVIDPARTGGIPSAITQQPQLTVKIIKPVQGQKFNLGENIVFQGSADEVIERVRLIADNQFPLSEVEVVNGQWTTSYQFNRAGNRKITAEGFATSGRTLAQASVEIVIGSSVSSISCSKNQLFTIGGHKVWKRPGQSVFFYKAGMSIDADGAPNAYNPQDKGIDFLANAGKPENWFAIVTDTGKPNGNPVVQRANDPAPGFFVSTTALEDTSHKTTDPRRYIDAAKMPYVVLPANPLLIQSWLRSGIFNF